MSRGDAANVERIKRGGFAWLTYEDFDVLRRALPTVVIPPFTHRLLNVNRSYPAERFDDAFLNKSL